MFKARKLKKAQEQYLELLQHWKSELDTLKGVMHMAQSGVGENSETVVLKSGESVFASVSSVGLIEMRKGRGTYSGGSQGVSIPIGSIAGRSVRYRVGGTKGHYVQGTPHPESVDNGLVVMTNLRIIFVGATKTIECLIDKLVSVQVGTGEFSLGVSNRQKPMVIHYGAALDEWVKVHIQLCIAVHNGNRESFAEGIEKSIQLLENGKPQPRA